MENVPLYGLFFLQISWSVSVTCFNYTEDRRFCFCGFLTFCSANGKCTFKLRSVFVVTPPDENHSLTGWKLVTSRLWQCKLLQWPKRYQITACRWKSSTGELGLWQRELGKEHLHDTFSSGAYKAEKLGSAPRVKPEILVSMTVFSTRSPECYYSPNDNLCTFPFIFSQHLELLEQGIWQ